MPNLLERALAALAPSVAAKRAFARRRLELIEGVSSRLYEGASRSRRTQGWRTTGSSADSELVAASDLLRQRSRDLVRNNAFASRIIAAHADYIIGAGIVPRAKTGKPKRDAAIDQLFDRWSQRCTSDGIADFYGLQYIACREMIEGGDVFARRRWRSEPIAGLQSKDKIVPLQIQLLEAEFLDRAKNGPVGPNYASAGIEFDGIGGRRGYWLFQQHPGAAVPNPKLSRDSRFIPATEVAHLFEPQRQQEIGAPWLAPVIVPLRDLDEYNQAELIRKKIEACVVGVVIPGDNDDQPLGISSPGDQHNGLTDAGGFPVERFEPGMIAYAANGRDIRFNNPAVSGGLEQYLRAQHRKIAAGARIPYELMSGDYSQSNFSSNRMGVIAYRRFIEHVQWHIVIPLFCQPIWDWFIEAARVAGAVKKNEIVPVEWATPRHEALNPIDDVKADILAVRAGIRSMTDVIASTGRSNEAVLQEIADWNKKVDELGIVLDSDPRKIAINGQLQMAADASTAEAQGSDTGVEKPKTNEKLNGKANGAGSHPH